MPRVSWPIWVSRAWMIRLSVADRSSAASTCAGPPGTVPTTGAALPASSAACAAVRYPVAACPCAACHARIARRDPDPKTPSTPLVSYPIAVSRAWIARRRSDDRPSAASPACPVASARSARATSARAASAGETPGAVSGSGVTAVTSGTAGWACSGTPVLTSAPPASNWPSLARASGARAPLGKVDR